MTRNEDTWIAVSADELPVAEALAWASGPDCGAVVSFCGSVRNASEGRPGVVSLEYEAYEAYVTAKMAEVADAVRAHFPEVRRIALLHRVGVLQVGEVSVAVVVATPHRADAFEAAGRARHGQGDGADLEARDLGRGIGLGAEHGVDRRRDRSLGTLVRRPRRSRRRRIAGGESPQLVPHRRPGRH